LPPGLHEDVDIIKISRPGIEHTPAQNCLNLFCQDRFQVISPDIDRLVFKARMKGILDSSRGDSSGPDFLLWLLTASLCSQENLDIFPDNFLDSELFGIAIEQINIPFFFTHISFQCLVNKLDIDLVPAPHYITDRPFKVRSSNFITMRRFHRNDSQIEQIPIYIEDFMPTSIQ
jgi:hypothetical protein